MFHACNGLAAISSMRQASEEPGKLGQEESHVLYLPKHVLRGDCGINYPPMR